jgi:hypothetical protein
MDSISRRDPAGALKVFVRDAVLLETIREVRIEEIQGGKLIGRQGARAATQNVKRQGSVAEKSASAKKFQQTPFPMGDDGEQRYATLAINEGDSRHENDPDFLQIACIAAQKDAPKLFRGR